MKSNISPTAIIDKNSKIHPSVTIGAYTIIGKNVEIGEGTTIGANVIIYGPTTIGKKNKIYPFAVLGCYPQDLSCYDKNRDIKKKAIGSLSIGNKNIIREFCTINLGTTKIKEKNAKTIIGSNNLLMSYVHIAHDCNLDDNIVMVNNSSLAGHVQIESNAILSGFSLVRQKCCIGTYAFIGLGCSILNNIPPYILVKNSNTTAVARGINSTGLKRAKFSTYTINLLKDAFKEVVCKNKNIINDRIEKFEHDNQKNDEIVNFIEFIKNYSKNSNGIIAAQEKFDV